MNRIFITNNISCHLIASTRQLIMKFSMISPIRFINSFHKHVAPYKSSRCLITIQVYKMLALNKFMRKTLGTFRSLCASTVYNRALCAVDLVQSEMCNGSPIMTISDTNKSGQDNKTVKLVTWRVLVTVIFIMSSMTFKTKDLKCSRVFNIWRYL